MKANAPIIEWLRTAERGEALAAIFEDPSLIDTIVAEYDEARAAGQDGEGESGG